MKQHSRRINFYQVLINFSIADFTSYTEKMEEFLEEELRNFNEWFNDKTKDWTEAERSEYGESLSDEYWILAETHPNFLRSSMFTSIYSFIEKKMKELSQTYKINENVVEKSPGLRRSKAAISLNLLEQSYDIEFSKEIEEWNRIDNVYREIRNKIVHDGGEVRDEELRQYNLLTESYPFKLQQSTGDLLLEKEFCFRFLNDTQVFFDELLRRIEGISISED